MRELRFNFESVFAPKLLAHKLGLSLPCLAEQLWGFAKKSVFYGVWYSSCSTHVNLSIGGWWAIDHSVVLHSRNWHLKIQTTETKVALSFEGYIWKHASAMPTCPNNHNQTEVHPTSPQSTTTEQLPHFLSQRALQLQCRNCSQWHQCELLQDRGHTFCIFLPQPLPQWLGAASWQTCTEPQWSSGVTESLPLMRPQCP